MLSGLRSALSLTTVLLQNKELLKFKSTTYLAMPLYGCGSCKRKHGLKFELLSIERVREELLEAAGTLTTYVDKAVA